MKLFFSLILIRFLSIVISDEYDTEESTTNIEGGRTADSEEEIWFHMTVVFMVLFILTGLLVCLYVCRSYQDRRDVENFHYLLGSEGYREMMNVKNHQEEEDLKVKHATMVKHKMREKYEHQRPIPPHHIEHHKKEKSIPIHHHHEHHNEKLVPTRRHSPPHKHKHLKESRESNDSFYTSKLRKEKRRK